MKRASKLRDRLPREIVLCSSLEIFSFLLDTTVSNWIWSHCNHALSRRLGWKYCEVPLNPNSDAMISLILETRLFVSTSQMVISCCDSGVDMLWICCWKLYYAGHQSSELIISCRNIWLPILCQTAILCLSTALMPAIATLFEITEQFKNNMVNHPQIFVVNIIKNRQTVAAKKQFI